ncbi:MAG: hypothetical protein AAF533_22880 [Acidobacteriota bacterium]
MQFRSWGGCIWNLFANCDGTDTPQFDIYDSECAAHDAVNPLPELIVSDVALTDAPGCRVEACATVSNIGCVVSGPSSLRLETELDVVVAPLPEIDSGAAVEVCELMDAGAASGAAELVSVTAIVDVDDTVVECREVTDASSCTPPEGARELTVQAEVGCNPCASHDFEGFPAGTIIAGQYANLLVSGSSPTMLFDSGSPGCDDFDLVTPGDGAGNESAQGLVLILDEGGDCSPDDAADGGVIVFELPDPGRVESVGLLDIDEAGTVVRAFDAAGELLGVFAAADLGENSFQRVLVELDLVARFEVELVGSGAVTDLGCHAPPPPRRRIAETREGRRRATSAAPLPTRDRRRP